MTIRKGNFYPLWSYLTSGFTARRTHGIYTIQRTFCTGSVRCITWRQGIHERSILIQYSIKLLQDSQQEGYMTRHGERLVWSAGPSSNHVTTELCKLSFIYWWRPLIISYENMSILPPVSIYICIVLWFVYKQ